MAENEEVAEVVEEVEEVAPVTDAEESGEVETATDAEPSGEEVAAEPTPEDVQRGVEKKIAKITQKRREAEREAQYWKGVASGNKPQAQPEPNQNVAPSPDQFDNYDDYLDARAGYVADKRFAEHQAKAAEQQQLQAHGTKVNQIIASGNKKYDDFDELTRAIPLSRISLAAATETENGDDVVYFLGSNPDEAERIAGLAPLSQALAIKDISIKLATPQKKATSKAPAPIKPVGGGGKGELQYSPDMSDKEYRLWRAQHKK